MSYVRFSSDDFQSDVYAYEDCGGGFTIHVASTKRIFSKPLPEKVPFEKGSLNAWLERHQKVVAMLENSSMVPIGLPHDGESFNVETEHEMFDKLRNLKAMGYSVPEEVFSGEETEG